MKRFSVLFAGLATILIAALAWSSTAQAHSFRTGNNVAVGQSETINHSLFVAGQTVDINSEVFGDVFCAGQTITIGGTVHGDVICAGQTIHVTGTVDGNVRLAGQTVTLGAHVKGNATVGGQTFTLESAGNVGGDATIGSTTATINGSVGRDLAIASASTTVSSTVGRDIKAAGTNLTLVGGSHVLGNVDFTSANDVTKQQSVTVDGKISRHDPPKQGEPKHGAVFGFGLGWFVYWFLAMLLTAMLLVLLLPKVFHNATDKTVRSPWKALLVGFVASLAVPVGLVVVAVTVVGLPLALLLGLAWLVIAMLSGPFFAYYLGRLVLSDSTKPLLIMLVGATLLAVFYFIPILGGLVALTSFWVGTGIVLLALAKRYSRPSYNLANSKK